MLTPFGGGTTLSPTGEFAGEYGPIATVDGSRVWWATDEGTGAPVSGGGASRLTVWSRPLRGGKLHAARLAVDRLAFPERGGLLRPYEDIANGAIELSDGHAVVAGEWITSPPAGDNTESAPGTGVVAVFDALTGAVVSQRPLALGARGPVETLIPSTPATLRQRYADEQHLPPSADWVLSDAVTQARLPVGGEQIAGRYVLGYTTSAKRWGGRGEGWLVVRDRVTGAEHYRLQATTIFRAAGTRGRSSVQVQLQQDGTLRTRVAAGRGLRPVAVDAGGAVRPLGAFQRYARSAPAAGSSRWPAISARTGRSAGASACGSSTVIVRAVGC